MIKKTKDLIIALQNHIQFQSIKKGIDILIRDRKSIDLYVPVGRGDKGYSDMYENLYKYLISKRYNVIRTVEEAVLYKILLEPYPIDFYGKINYKYRLKYKYSSLSAKPNPVYKPEHNICYDGILCYGNYEANCLKAYTNTYIIENFKYTNYKKKVNKGKPTLLYLPTFGDVSSVEDITNAIPNLKKEYKFVTKFHHATSFLKEEKKRFNKLKGISDEWYDQNTKLIDLLSISDVVLSDNSGSIFEAIYADVPVCIFSKDINANKLETFNTPQFEIVKADMIPHANNPNEIISILNKASSKEYINKRKKIKNDYYLKQESINNLNIELDRINNNNAELQLEINGINNNNTELQLEINRILTIINKKDNQLNYYQNQKLYKLANKLYKFKNKIKSEVKLWEKIK